MTAIIALASSVAALSTNSQPDTAAQEPVQLSLTLVVNNNELFTRFDGRMHGRITAAKTEADWQEVTDILMRAAQNGNLRRKVRDRFLSKCPFANMKAALRQELGIVDPEEAKKKADAEANERFDDRMVYLMKHGQWDTVKEILMLALERNNLRPRIRLNFLRYCPEEYISEFKVSTESFGPMPTRPVQLSAQEQERRRTDSRAARVALQPAKGGSSSGGNSSRNKNKKK